MSTEDLRIGILADIAAVTAMTKATAQAAAPGANAPSGVEALFAALLQNVTQSAGTQSANTSVMPSVTPANDGAQPAAQNDNTEASQAPLNMANLLAMLQNPAAKDAGDKKSDMPTGTAATTGTPSSTSDSTLMVQQGAQQAASQPAAPSAQQQTNTGKDGPAAKTDQPAAAPANTQAENKNTPDAGILATMLAQTGTSQPATVAQGPASPIGTATDTKDAKASGGAAKDTKDAKAAATDGATVMPNASTSSQQAAPTIVAAFVTQQIQAATPSSGNTETGASVAVQPAVAQASAKAGTPALPADSKAPANTKTPAIDPPASGTTPDAKKTAAGATNTGKAPQNGTQKDGTGAPAQNAGAAPSNARPTFVADTVKNDTPAKSSPAASAAGLPQASHPSASGQSDPSVIAAMTPAPVATASTTSVAAHLQVAPQHHDSSAAATANLDNLGVTIAAKSAGGTQHFDIRMDPPELGRVQVHLSVDDSGKAQATLIVDKPQTLELLQRDAPNLNRTLTDAGLNLSNNGLNFSLRGQDRQNDGGGVDKGRSRSLSVKAVVGTTSTSSSIASVAPNSVRLDIRV